MSICADKSCRDKAKADPSRILGPSGRCDICFDVVTRDESWYGLTVGGDRTISLLNFPKGSGPPTRITCSFAEWTHLISTLNAIITSAEAKGDSVRVDSASDANASDAVRAACPAL